MTSGTRFPPLYSFHRHGVSPFPGLGPIFALPHLSSSSWPKGTISHAARHTLRILAIACGSGRVQFCQTGRTKPFTKRGRLKPMNQFCRKDWRQSDLARRRKPFHRDGAGTYAGGIACYRCEGPPTPEERAGLEGPRAGNSGVTTAETAADAVAGAPASSSRPGHRRSGADCCTAVCRRISVRKTLW